MHDSKLRGLPDTVAFSEFLRKHPQLEKLQPSDRHNHLLAIKQDADVSLPEAPPETQALPSCYKTLTLGPGARVAGIVVKMGVTRWAIG